MKRTVIFTLTILLGWSQAEEEPKSILAQDQAPPSHFHESGNRRARPAEGWIGVTVRKPELALQAHLVGIPKGVGFTVKTVDPTGPAALAGLRPYDYLWKMDDQLLINEGQFIALLALRELGESVQLTYQRQGKDVVTEVTLKERPKGVNGGLEAAGIVTVPPVPGMPTRRISVQERYAELDDAAGVVKVKRGRENFYWMAWDAEGEKVGHGRLGLPDERGQVAFPEDFKPLLKNKLSALIRGYEHAAGRGVTTTRMPRVRRVPTPKDDLVPKEE